MSDAKAVAKLIASSLVDGKDYVPAPGIVFDYDAITRHLTKIYKQWHRLKAHARVPNGSSIIPPWHLLSAVEDAKTGLEYAAHSIGQTVLYMGGGKDALNAIMHNFEMVHGSMGAEWLDWRWDGIEYDGFVWCT